MYQIISIFTIIFLEYACFPVSSEIVLPLSGVLASQHRIPFLFLLVLCTVAGALGTTLTYFIGRLGGAPLLARLGKRFHKVQKSIDSSMLFMHKHGKLGVCLGRIIPLFRTYIGFAAGIAKLPYLSYILSSAVGILLWNSVLLAVGYYFWSYRTIFFTYYEKYNTIFFIAAGISFASFLLYLIRKRKSAQSP